MSNAPGTLAASVAHARSAPPAATQGACNNRTSLQKFDSPQPGYETVIGSAVIAPDAAIGAPTHLVVGSSDLLQSEMMVMLAGLPDLVLKVGDCYQIQSGAGHDGKLGAAGAKVNAAFVVEHGKASASSAL